VLAVASACGAPSGGRAPTGDGRERSPSSKASVRMNASQVDNAVAEHKRMLDAIESNVEVALRVTATGKADKGDSAKKKKKDAKPSADEPIPLSEAVRSVRAKKMTMIIKAVPEKDLDDKGVLMLDVDAFQASLKALPPSVWKTDRDGMQAATQRFSMISVAVSRASLAVLQTSIATQAVNIRGMVAIAALKKDRGAWASWAAEDKTAAKKLMADGRRSAMIGATATALVAGYQGVIKDNQDPKALDVYAEKTLAAFPIKVDVSDEDAQAYVDGLDDAKLKDSKSRYETMLRETYGDATYEKKYKRDLDKAFDQLEAPDPVAKKRAKADDPGVAAPGKAGAALRGAAAVANGDAAGALDAAADLVPADSPVRQSLKGVSALMKGDTKGALKAALALAPLPGPTKDGINAVMGLFGL
jgi:hypothetical protein